MGKKWSRSERGSAPLLVLLAITFIFAISYGNSFFKEIPKFNGDYLLYSLCCFTSVVFLARHEWKHNRNQFFNVWVAINLIFIVIMTFTLYERQEAPLHALALISILFANIVWSAIYLYKVSRFVEPLPDWLMKQFGYAAIYEEKDIQFVIITGANEITDENQYSFCYILQNCSNAERVVQVKINVEKNWSFSSKGLIVPSEIQQIVPAGTTGIFRIPVIAESGKNGKFTIRPKMTVKGEKGQRIRLRRGKRSEGQISPLVAVLGIFVGMHVFGGGFKLELTVKTKEDAGPLKDPGKPTWEETYRPTPEEMEMACRKIAEV